jgi:AcrR family transcriptional regulator
MDDKGPRDRMLDAATDYVAEHGIGDVSLRSLASALGTSHRMLIHHFGSKEGLWIEIVHTVEARQREMLGELLPDPDQPIREAMWTWWKHISDPSLWPATEINVARGVPRELARAHARSGVAITRGLLLDLLATGDVAGVDAAMDAFIDLYEAWVDRAARPSALR